MQYEVCDWPTELEDARARTNQARDNFNELGQIVYNFHEQYVRRMLYQTNPDGQDSNVYVQPPGDLFVKGKPSALIAQIVDHMRAALDYTIMQLSTLRIPHVHKRSPAFVIADTKEAFVKQGKTKLKDLTSIQRGLVEQLQPYNGSAYLRVLREIVNPG